MQTGWRCVQKALRGSEETRQTVSSLPGVCRGQSWTETPHLCNNACETRQLFVITRGRPIRVSERVGNRGQPLQTQAGTGGDGLQDDASCILSRYKEGIGRRQA